MRLVELIDGALELRWTWLPYWLATNGKLKSELEDELRDVAVVNALTNDPLHLDWLHAFVCRRIQARFPKMYGLEAALRSFGIVRS